VAGYNLRSYATDGTERWHVTVRDGSPEYLAQVAGIAVTSSWTGSVRGLDLATGAERWSWKTGEIENSESVYNWYADQAFTDGRFVLLVLHREDGMLGLASLDAASGELVWARTAREDYNLPQEVSLFSVDGHLLAVTPTGITGLG
jgi:outer membrane protein assembly factor BamB